MQGMLPLSSHPQLDQLKVIAPEQRMVSNAMYLLLAMVILVAVRSFNAIIALLVRLGRYGCGLVVVLGKLPATKWLRLKSVSDRLFAKCTTQCTWLRQTKW